MKLMVFDMEITGTNNGNYFHSIIHENQQAVFGFNPATRLLFFETTNSLTRLLKKNLSQLHKILHAKRFDTFYKGFKLKFILTDNTISESFNDMNKIVVLDRRNGGLTLDVVKNGTTGIPEIFSDGCYLDQHNRSGFATIIKYSDASYKLFTLHSKAGNNCLAELEAAIQGFEMLKNTTKVRLITDSRYVRKGLTEWMINWRLNDWKTANGETAKNVDAWKKLDVLTQLKYVEVAWIKGHSGHFENTMCDLYARDAAEQRVESGER